jgi:hypothetical protein
VGHYSSFILRLWVDAQDGRRWGLIQHVSTRDKCRFSTLSEMLDFIRQHSGGDDFSQLSFTDIDDLFFNGSDVRAYEPAVREDAAEKNP